ncbi:fimbria/pilus outer membrane usher protein [Salmonella enterica]|uniref:fimbria/pilus outer membrane usher protein n=1 Tax=Salmonella enterica TaxID=28901 RepID=UPI002F2B6920
MKISGMMALTSFLLNYRANYLHSKVGGEDSYFGQIQPGFNFGPWRLRNLSSWQNLSSEKKFESAYIYAERGLKKNKEQTNSWGQIYQCRFIR